MDIDLIRNKNVLRCSFLTTITVKALKIYQSNFLIFLNIDNSHCKYGYNCICLAQTHFKIVLNTFTYRKFSSFKIHNK